MNINDIVTLCRAGFSADVITNLLALERQQAAPAQPAVPTPRPQLTFEPAPTVTTPTTPGGFSPVFTAGGDVSSFPPSGGNVIPAASPANAGPVTPPAAPAGSNDLAATLAAMQASIDALRVPQPGSIGAQPQTVTSVDDIILASVRRGAASTADNAPIKQEVVNNAKS